MKKAITIYRQNETAIDVEVSQDKIWRFVMMNLKTQAGNLSKL